jgi:hypothetical protein
VDRQTATAFVDLQATHTRLLPYMIRKDLHDALDPSFHNRKRPTAIKIKVNVYADHACVPDVGALLLKYDLFLQNPAWKENGMQYNNPQVLTFPDLSEAEVLLKRTSIGASEAQNPVNGADWARVLDNLPQYNMVTESGDQSQLKIPLQP